MLFLKIALHVVQRLKYLPPFGLKLYVRHVHVAEILGSWIQQLSYIEVRLFTLDSFLYLCGFQLGLGLSARLHEFDHSAEVALEGFLKHNLRIVLLACGGRFIRAGDLKESENAEEVVL